MTYYPTNSTPHGNDLDNNVTERLKIVNQDVLNVSRTTTSSFGFQLNQNSNSSVTRSIVSNTESPVMTSTKSIFDPFIFYESSTSKFSTTESEPEVPQLNVFFSNKTDTMLPTTELVLTVIPLSLICLGIVLGNLLVIVAVFTQKSLRSPQNIYIVSLALADMTVGIVILPINIAHIIMQKWIFGEVFCKIYLTTDVSLCCGSIFHLCLIGIDRYRAITEGINYMQERNLKDVLWSIGILWIIAIWISSPPLLAVNNWNIVYDGENCALPSMPGYAFHLFIGGLLFPLIIMSAIYWNIYKSIQARLRERATVTCIELTSDADSTDNKLDESSDNTLDEPTEESASGDNCTDTTKKVNQKSRAKRKQSEQVRTFLMNKQRFSLSRERKAAKTLGIIMGAFIICWLPLGFLNIIGSLCPEDKQPDLLIFHIFTWLGYVNSGLNPIIYGISNQQFKKAFKRVLHLE